MGFNRDKFKALVHYVCKQCHDPEKLSKTKLHKILWYSDTNRYVITRQSITGELYIKEKYGPYSTHLNSIVRELVGEGRMYADNIEYNDVKQGRFVAKGEPDTSLFSSDELRVINENIKTICEDHTPGTISEKSHKLIYDIATMGQEIPYEAMLVRNLVPTRPEDIEWAKSELARLFP